MAQYKETDTGLQQLKAAIRSKTPDRLYIFHGEEIFLLNHYLGQLKKILIEDLTESFNFHYLTGETFNVQSFVDAVENLPMMAEHTMVLVDDVDIFKLPEADRNKIGETLMDIPEWCTVVFTYETVLWNPDKRMKNIWDAISFNAKIVEFPKQEMKDLMAWVARHFGANGKQISNDLCAYLIDITGGTMTTLAGEIGKICAYSGADMIVRSDIDAVTEPVIDAVVYQMSDLMGRQDFTAALQKLQQLLKMQNDPIAILGVIGGHFRRLSAASVLLSNGKGAADLMKMCGIKDYPARKAMEAARRFKPEFYKKASELILETDYRMKTSFDEPERLLELLVLQLAQEARL